LVRGEALPSLEAARLYKLAADGGNAFAQGNLGSFYESGRGGLTKNVAEAVRLYELAANQGNAWARDRLAQMRNHKGHNRR
jgi:TPR repeat protein